MVPDSALLEFSNSIPPLQLAEDHPGFEIESVTSKIEGCLFPGEEIFLAQLAKSCIGKGVIVEIGSYLGRSTVSLGLGSMQGSRTMVFTFDHFQGDPFMQVSLSQYQTLLNNVRRSSADSIIITSTVSSDRAAKEFTDPIELLFFDADHTFESVELDFLQWSPKVIDGGVIAFHDTYDPVMQGLRFDGPLRVIQKYCQAPGWKVIGRFQSITIVKKNGEPKKLAVPEKQVMSKSVLKRLKIQKGGKW